MIARGTGEFPKFRLLISGRSNSGKTWSIHSFDEEGQSLVVLVCPGETGNRSLPEDSDRVTSYFYQSDSGADTHSADWSKEALYTFQETYKEIEKNKPDKLFIDGLHWLYSHSFNEITNGEWHAGVDMNINPSTGRNDPYRSARFYNFAHTRFGQYLASMYASSIPFIGMTVWEQWQSGRSESDKAGSIDAVRYLHPALPGEMATNVAGRFDARLSARVERRCIHTNCAESKAANDHFVWQFLPKNDVMGVGIKGLPVTPAYMEKPWIHQTWSALKALLKKR